uniref:Uncharacterized protein n=1 Tax=Trichobilharzia regenti TaxID=157069 RepID=A0AA85J746_TRIRE|nr:unnamed protein product [Trichobilharzia regenti]
MNVLAFKILRNLRNSVIKCTRNILYFMPVMKYECASLHNAESIEYHILCFQIKRQLKSRQRKIRPGNLKNHHNSRLYRRLNSNETATHCSNRLHSTCSHLQFNTLFRIQEKLENRLHIPRNNSFTIVYIHLFDTL